MSSVQAEVFQAFRKLNVPEADAMEAAKTLSKRDEDVVGLKTDAAVIRGELVLHRWLLGLIVGLQITVLVKLFVH